MSAHTSPAGARPRARRPVAPVTQTGAVEVFRRSDMAPWGIDPDCARTYIKQGLWIRLHRGVYTDAGVLAACGKDPERLHRLMARAAIAALPIAAYTIGPTGALVHGLPRPGDPPETVTLVRDHGSDQRALRRRLRMPTTLTAVRVHSHRLLDTDITLVDGLPTVTRDIAAVTAAAECSHEWAVAVLDAAAWQRPDGVDALGAVVDRWPWLRGVGTVRAALGLVRPGAQSPFESLSRVRLVGHGLPEPRLQVPFHDRAGLIGYADMAWDQWRVIGECDGLAKYADRDDLIREKLREDRLRALGFAVVRWTWRELMSDSAAVASRVLSAAGRDAPR